MKHSVTRNRTARVVSERVRAIMDKHGWSISDVARQGSTARSNVNFAYHGKGVPNGTVLVVLAKALRTSVAYLLGEDVPEHAAEPASDDQLAEWVETFRMVDQERIESLEGTNRALEAHMADAKRVVDKVNAELKNVRAHYTAMESRAAAVEAKLRAAQAEPVHWRGVVDELKADNNVLRDKADAANRDRKATLHRYFALAEAAERAIDKPTWSTTHRGYVITSDNMAGLRKSLNKAPLAGYSRDAPGEGIPTVIAFPDGTRVDVVEAEPEAEAKNGNGVA